MESFFVIRHRASGQFIGANMGRLTVRDVVDAVRACGCILMADCGHALKFSSADNARAALRFDYDGERYCFWSSNGEEVWVAEDTVEIVAVQYSLFVV